MRETKQSAASKRRERLRLDQNLARAATPSIAKTISAERRRVRAAVASASTPGEWEKAARQAVSTDAWVKAIVGLWLSPRLKPVWDAQQKILGTDYPMPPEVRKILTGYASDHGKAIADSRRDRLSRLVARNKKAADRYAATREFRSTMRAALSEEYATVATDAAARIAWSETLQASETVRYESSRVSATRSELRIRKVWFTQGDSKVRPKHSKANGQSRFVDHRGWGGAPGRFNVGGESLRYPRDPNGSAGNVINCRCFLEYRRVRVPAKPNT
jgi:hypothetical protein